MASIYIQINFKMYSATKFDDFILFKQKSVKFRLTLITGYRPMSIVLQAVEWELPVRVKIYSGI